ncbi:MAG: Ig-like domain-containing protein, partial [Bacteroidales bacterium]|nr:Ig-like domain-containing protein [Bacteroidales bacterium]
MKKFRKVSNLAVIAMAAVLFFGGCKKDKDSAPVAVSGISLDKATLPLVVGATAELKATVLPDNAADKTVKWTSSDDTKATVSNGAVTAVAAGTATITAKAGDKTATCTVTVSAVPVAVSSISLDKTTLPLAVGATAPLAATVLPSNATDKTVTWTSSDNTKATVSNGTVTAVAVGTATITAKAGDKTATCTVTVSAVPVAVSSISLDKTTLP